MTDGYSYGVAGGVCRSGDGRYDSQVSSLRWEDVPWGKAAVCPKCGERAYCNVPEEHGGDGKYHAELGKNRLWWKCSKNKGKGRGCAFGIWPPDGEIPENTFA